MRRPARLLAFPLLCGLALTACSGSGQGAETSTERPVINGAHAVGGTISVEDAFLVAGRTGQARLYLAIYNTGPQPDHLTAVSTPVASAVRVPGGSLQVGNGIALLESPSKALAVTGVHRTLAIGDQIPVTLTFTDAGTVRVVVPVEGPQGFAPAGSAPASSPAA